MARSRQRGAGLSEARRRALPGAGREVRSEGVPAARERVPGPRFRDRRNGVDGLLPLMGIPLNSEELLKDDPLNPQVPHLRVIGNSRAVVILSPASETTPSDHLPALSLKSRKRLLRESHPPSFWPGWPPPAGPLLFSHPFLAPAQSSYTGLSPESQRKAARSALH